MSNGFLDIPVNRRQFLQVGGLLTFSLLANGISGWAAKPLMQASGASDGRQPRLVVIFLRGAADGLSILVPYGDSNYYGMRRNIAIPKPGQAGGALPLDNYFGLNPNLEAILPYWKQGNVSFVVNSGSSDPTRSHFDAQDYMESGTPGIKSTDTGWLNRMLQQLPDTHSPTRALNVGSTMPRILQGSVDAASVSTQAKANRFSALDRPAVSSAFEAMYRNSTDDLGKNFREGMEARESLMKSLEEEMIVANKGAPAASQFGVTGNRIAQLIKNDPSIQVVFTALGSWDTHVNQGSSQGALARQLKGLGDGLGSLMTGLSESGHLDQTTIVVMSEFGRTAHENGNGGTDHGHGNVMWLLGGRVKGKQIAGHWTGLSQQALNEGRDMPVTSDFRAIYSSLLTSQYGLSAGQIQKIFPKWQVVNQFPSLFKSPTLSS